MVSFHLLAGWALCHERLCRSRGSRGGRGSPGSLARPAGPRPLTRRAAWPGQQEVRLKTTWKPVPAAEASDGADCLEGAAVALTRCLSERSKCCKCRLVSSLLR